MATEPNAEAFAAADVATIVVGGKSWPVPKLAIKQLRLLQGKLDSTVKTVIVDNTPLADLTVDQFDTLAYVIWVALTRAHPALTKDELDDLETDRSELALALLPVALQAYGRKATKPGEAEGVESPQTSTEPLPASPAA